MAITKTLGGDRLGSGAKQKVHMHGFERSTHDLGYIWRSTMSAGTLVPFLSKVALPGDTWDINLNCDIMTHPTIGPLLGSYKVQLDVFQCPVRLYQALLHNNKLKVGLNMAAVKLPIMQLTANVPTGFDQLPNWDQDNYQINPSSILSHLGIRGVGQLVGAQIGTPTIREFNALKLLMYWDIYKNYYANKQEELGAVIHTTPTTITESIDSMAAGGLTAANVPQAPATGNAPLNVDEPATFEITYLTSPPIPAQVLINTSIGQFTLEQLCTNFIDNGTDILTGYFDWQQYGNIIVYSWQYVTIYDVTTVPPKIVTFPLSNIDDMREWLLAQPGNVAANINAANIAPYNFILGPDNVGDENPTYRFTQEGLAIKTYQSDLLQNWLSTEWIDGEGGINEITAIDTSSGSFTIDTLQLSKKVYDMLNRVAVSGGSYQDWLEAVYDHQGFFKAESPMYCGGLIKELIFQEITSTAADSQQGQPLGTLAGKGRLASKHKGGQITIKVDEISYIFGIVSLTPRIDYSQGNAWENHLLTMDDFHKPGLDGIGFQELITEQMAWWDTLYSDVDEKWVQRSAGKQPAWLNYMTSVNETRGNFAIQNNEMFMTLNRRYEFGLSPRIGIEDLTTYIDPAKFNYVFAQTSIDAQNFWVQIACDIECRRKMSAKLMPNL